MHRNRVNSSSLSSIGYDRRSRVLEVEYGSGSVYRYRQVPASTYEQLMQAPSKGRFVNQFVREVYPFTRVN